MFENKAFESANKDGVKFLSSKYAMHYKREKISGYHTNAFQNCQVYTFENFENLLKVYRAIERDSDKASFKRDAIAQLRGYKSTALININSALVPEATEFFQGKTIRFTKEYPTKDSSSRSLMMIFLGS